MRKGVVITTCSYGEAMQLSSVQLFFTSSRRKSAFCAVSGTR